MLIWLISTFADLYVDTGHIVKAYASLRINLLDDLLIGRGPAMEVAVNSARRDLANIREMTNNQIWIYLRGLVSQI